MITIDEIKLTGEGTFTPPTTRSVVVDGQKWIVLKLLEEGTAYSTTDGETVILRYLVPIESEKEVFEEVIRNVLTGKEASVI